VRTLNPALRGLGQDLRRSWTVLGLGWILAGTAEGVGAESVSFSRDILPILSDNCFACHGPDEGARKAKLRLDTHEGVLGSGKSGEIAVVPGQVTASELIHRVVTADPDDVMPPPKSNRKLTPAQIELLQRWVAEGARWGRHWAFETPRRPNPPVFLGSAGRNPLDAFVRTRLEREGLEPAPEASRATLLRRLTLDLTGLPPRPEEIAAFEREESPGAYERQVDRLLASPRYGERMAWEWLEAARYADSNGYQGDSERTMWPWRDWVVNALNRNLPFDQFTVWQLAGDLVPTPTREQRLATGFVRNHMINGEGGRIPEENRIDYLFDQAETTATVWLGATFNCTRCHDHKYDPYTQRDYFSLVAFFNRTAVDGSGGDPQSKPNLEVPSSEQLERQALLEQKLAATAQATTQYELTLFPRSEGQTAADSTAAKEAPKEVLEFLKQPAAQREAGRLEKLANHWKEMDPAYFRVLSEQRQTRVDRDAVVRGIPRVMVMEDVATPRDTFILNRGAYDKPGARVDAAVPACLTPFPPGAPTNRLGLAQWFLESEQPLTARVTVNRAWQTFLGIGLVKTAEDFGVQGERPMHLELVDWLATEFRESGWDVKHLHRLIVTSATYRQSSQVTPAAFERDPENRLLARGPRHRLPSWMIRDVALATAGLLVEDVGGPPVKPYQPSGIWEEATFGNKRYEQDHGAALYRRSLYVFWRRIVGPTLFFDVASRQTCTVKTPRTNVPLHALLTLNDVTYVESARALAERVQHTTGDDSDRIQQVGRWVLGREFTAEEVRVLTAALQRHLATFTRDPAAARQLLATGESPRDEHLDPAPQAAWTVLCSTVLNLDEALTKE